MRVMLVGSPGRSPFCGHFRGRQLGNASIWWAGRLRGSGSVEEGWGATEAARDAIGGLSGADRFALVDAAWAALRTLDARDLVLILVASDEGGIVVAGCGLSDVRADGTPLVAAGHPLLSEPGIPERPGYFHPDRPAEEFVGVPVGCQWPVEALHAACGWRLP